MSRPFSPESSSVSLETNLKIDSICLEYEDRWIRGGEPELESFVDDVEPQERPSLVYELLRIDLAYGAARRERLTEEAYRLRLPEYEDVVRAVFARRSAPAAMRSFAEGERIGRYRIQRELGRGGFGAVFLARDDELSRDVAIKTIRPDLVANEEAMRRLREEAMLAAQLNHTGIATLFALEQDEHNQPFLVYQYVEGESFREVLRRRDWDCERMADVVRQIAIAVEHAHQAGVTHRDLQPNNVLIGTDGHAVITDFGLAVHTDLRPPESGEIAGSPAYLAPEQTRGDARRIGARTDVWAMGVMLYETLTGRRPFTGPTPEDLFDAIQTYNPPPPSRLSPDVPRRHSDICQRCLNKAPEKRFSSAGALAKALDASQRHSRDRRRFLIASLAATPAVATAAAWPWLSAIGEEPLAARVTPLVLRDGFWSEVGSRRAPSVTNGDSLKIEIQLSRPAHLFLVWINGQGNATPLTPWVDGQWNSIRPTERVESLVLPDGLDSYWTMRTDRRASETLLLLADKFPPSDVSIRSAFADLPRQTSLPDATLVQFTNGVMRLAGDRRREPEFDSVQHQDHGVIVAQRILHRRLASRFSLIQALSFPVAP